MSYKKSINLVRTFLMNYPYMDNKAGTMEATFMSWVLTRTDEDMDRILQNNISSRSAD